MRGRPREPALHLRAHPAPVLCRLAAASSARSTSAGDGRIVFPGLGFRLTNAEPEPKHYASLSSADRDGSEPGHRSGRRFAGARTTHLSALMFLQGGGGGGRSLKLSLPLQIARRDRSERHSACMEFAAGLWLNKSDSHVRSYRLRTTVYLSTLRSLSTRSAALSRTPQHSGKRWFMSRVDVRAEPPRWETATVACRLGEDGPRSRCAERPERDPPRKRRSTLNAPTLRISAALDPDTVPREICTHSFRGAGTIEYVRNDGDFEVTARIHRA